MTCLYQWDVERARIYDTHFGDLVMASQPGFNPLREIHANKKAEDATREK